MELRQLRYLVAVAEERSFTRAAERLRISQPALGRQIAQLEAEIAADLLDRSHRPAALTAAGQVFYEHAVDILERVQALKGAVRNAGEHRARQVSVAYTSVSIYGYLPEVFRRLKMLDQTLNLKLLMLSDQAQIQALHDREVDLAFGQVITDDKGITTILLREEPLVLAVPLRHALAKGRAALVLRAIAGQSLILYPYPPHPNFSDQVRALLDRHGVQTGHDEWVDDPQTALSLVAASIGVTIVPKALESARQDVTFKAIKEQDAKCPIVLARREEPATRAQELVLCIVEQVLREHGWPTPAPFSEAASKARRTH